MNNQKCSIIVVTYGEEKYLERTIKSLLKIVYKNKEILCVDT